ncbi:hypothetical protein FACS1894184_16910 [Clostridia bacterium]|nr:hypothetical protein FACS1894184_16910 [Clostridia bacterium]
MKIQWLGTAAAEGWPALFCQCQYCKEAARRGGRELRSRCSILIDDMLLIDINPDLFHQKLTLGLDLGIVRDILISHAHDDHFTPFSLGFCLSDTCAKRDDSRPVNVYGSADTQANLHADGERVFHCVSPGDTVVTERHRVTVLPAAHGAPDPLLYLIKDDTASFLYGHDTGCITDDAWTILADALGGKPLTAASLDCTNGPLDQDYFGHMGFKQNLALANEMRNKGIANENTAFVSSHFSHNGGMLYYQAVDKFESLGLRIAYDGMTLLC